MNSLTGEKKNIQSIFKTSSQATLARGSSRVLHEEQGPGGLDQPLGAPDPQVPGEEGRRQGRGGEASVFCLTIAKTTKVLMA